MKKILKNKLNLFYKLHKLIKIKVILSTIQQLDIKAVTAKEQAIQIRKINLEAKVKVRKYKIINWDSQVMIKI